MPQKLEDLFQSTSGPVSDYFFNAYYFDIQVLERVLKIKEKKLQTELLAIENQGLQGN